MNRSLVLAAALLAVAAGHAEAHALLKTAEPAVGATVSAGPTELRLHFSEGVEPAFSAVEITANDAETITPTAIVTDPTDTATLVVRLPVPLISGQYRIHWHVVSVDSHKTRGDHDNPFR